MTPLGGTYPYSYDRGGGGGGAVGKKDRNYQTFWKGKF